MKAIVLSVGNEIISGHITDTNAAWIAHHLEAMGVDVLRHVAVGDDEEAVSNEVLMASRSADLVLITGGLGPTRDDITRQAVSAAAEVELETDEATLEQIRERFRHRGYTQMPESNRSQACIPAGAELLANARGTAAGFRIELNGAHVFSMPGVPPEMFAMFHSSVAPFIRSIASGGVHVTGSLECFGTSESVINGKIHDLMKPGRNPQIGLLVHFGQISIKIVARAEDEKTAAELVSEAKSDLYQRVGKHVFGEDGRQLEQVLGEMLTERKMTLATAESCTGGLISGKITDVPGSSKYFLNGYVTYSNEAKTKLLGVPPDLFETVGAVSEEVARSMAEGCLRETGADIAVASTGIAGPGGGTKEKPVGLVYIGIADRRGCRACRNHIHGGREQVRERAARIAMDHVRRRLLALA